MARKKTIPAQPEKTIDEEIHSFTVNYANQSVAVAIGAQSTPGTFDPGQRYETIQIAGTDYADLHAENGAGEVPGKPAGTFRKADLWPFVDRVRGNP